MHKKVNNKNANNSRTKSSTKSAVFQLVDLTIEAVLGEASLTVAELNDLEEDSILELSSALNQPINLRLNGISIAQGELVAVGDKYGVRITAIEQ